MASTGIDLSTAVWRKSSYSNGSGGECVEVSDAQPGVVIPVRDSKKAQDGPVLLFRPLAWTVFLDSLKD
ncbi:DUF397 domain-containing protein [Streptomyces barringtoniae]|uniref:DUF397 domain-containing protein n=1 Tax=Streptomyces barringtoniae TaxID=2892029 RepID=UPI001E46299B|nr:DUF397 domain-containing protein [Streptomyces barringtoniae]MCC5478695.1 DUF397 domain-containing protein [Streptomyces barringtoniae]